MTPDLTSDDGDNLLIDQGAQDSPVPAVNKYVLFRMKVDQF